MERLSVGLRDHGGLFRQDGPGFKYMQPSPFRASGYNRSQGSTGASVSNTFKPPS